MNETFALACAKAEQLINATLAHAADSQRLLAEMDGKSLAIKSHLPPAEFVITCGNGAVSLHAGTATKVTAQLSGALPSLILFATEEQNLDSYVGPINISGDHKFIAALRDTGRNLNIDWEGWLAEFIGDVPAHLVGRSARRAGKWRAQLVSRSAEGFNLYMKEEIKSAPWRSGSAFFSDWLASANNSNDRLIQQIDAVKSRLLNIFR